MRSEQNDALGMKLFSHSRRNFSDVFQRSHIEKLILRAVSGKRLEGVSLPLVLRERGNPLLQFLKRGKPGKQPGLRKLSGFGVQRHGDVRHLRDRQQSDEAVHLVQLFLNLGT